MSVKSAIFNSHNMKLAAALSVPVLVACLFAYSQRQADVLVKEYADEQKAHPTAERMMLKNYLLKEVDDSNHIRWQLSAQEGTVEDNHQIVSLKGVKVEYFDGPTLKMCLVAPLGTANESTKYVKLSADGPTKVSMSGEAGKASLYAQTVELTKKNQFLASGGVNIEWPKVAKVEGDTCSGTIDLNDFKNFKIVGNTHALIGVQ